MCILIQLACYFYGSLGVCIQRRSMDPRLRVTIVDWSAPLGNQKKQKGRYLSKAMFPRQFRDLAR